MAVQKSKPTRSKRGMRRSHDKCMHLHISQDKSSKEFHIRHHITKNGYYKGNLVLKIKNKKK
ncbi:50S ribosomal protein L32 [Buchnera aphidicola (Thelaxes californica)]|uniref:Large ribosomal subunit protein bL32 n=1 Tax=Buchnera aphidicola (Thelaxes californica) TaxID=1315998 RepID=A0A4D6YFD9_9GAMM|nr:50S ribosomal protein L32 [Buchnera aphidicola]QCI26803.1 50S ribosomal protein L32 [Buchnera aphidicola (Thelaxes californica)]